MRQEIINVIAEKLKLISKANGNSTDLGENFFEWRDKPLNNDEFPACILQDGVGSYDEDSGHILSFSVDVVVSGNINEEVAVLTRLAMQDAAHAVRDAVGSLGLYGNMSKTEMISDDKEKRYIAGRITCEVRYTTGEWDV